MWLRGKPETLIVKIFTTLCQVCKSGVAILLLVDSVCCFSVAFCNVFYCNRLQFVTMSVGKVVQNISPASQQRFELGISSSCCRSLFGPIDHAQLRAELKSELRRIADEKKRRWNFDFLEVKPLEGDFLWQRIGENSSVGFVTNDEPKSCFSERIMPQRSSTATTHAVSNATTRNTASHSRKTCFETPERLTAKRLRKSPRITGILLHFPRCFCIFILK